MLHALAALPRAARGEFEEAERHVVMAYDGAADMGTRWARAYASEARAFLAQTQGDACTFYEAAADFTRAHGSLEPGAHAMGPVLADSLMALGRFEEASSAIEEFENVVRGTGRRSAHAAAARVKAELAAAVVIGDRRKPCLPRRWRPAKNLPHHWLRASLTLRGGWLQYEPESERLLRANSSWRRKCRTLSVHEPMRF